MSKRGRFIVFDAIDGAGKTTQVALLLQRLRRLKKKVVVADFPQYERSFFGKMVRRYLAGEFGRVDKTNPYLISLLYALDRYEARDRLKQYLAQGKIIVSDRYSPANKIHQAAKIKSRVQKKEFLNWLDKMEFRILGIPRPHLVLFLDVPPQITKRLVLARGRRDMHEIDMAHQKRAYQQSLALVRQYRHWKRIVCVEHNVLLSPEEIHQRVWQEVRKVIE